MKEVLTKKFWQDVKKTFEDAQLNEPPTQVTPLKKESSQEAEPGEPGSAAQTGVHAADPPKE
jgi:hypothetical protein